MIREAHMRRVILVVMAQIMAMFTLACQDHSRFDGMVRDLVDAAVEGDSTAVVELSSSPDVWKFVAAYREHEPELWPAANEGLSRILGKVKGEEAAYFYSFEHQGHREELGVIFVREGDGWSIAVLQLDRM